MLDFTRCGDDSAQCIKLSDKCDGVNDCANGWDESSEQCVDSAIQSFFVSDGMVATCQFLSNILGPVCGAYNLFAEAEAFTLCYRCSGRGLNNRPIRNLNYVRKFLLFCHRVVYI